MVVPNATSNGSTKIKIVKAPWTTERAHSVLSSQGGCTCLLLQEPNDKDWMIWDAIQSGPEDLMEIGPENIEVTRNVSPIRDVIPI